jgi:hypothetical protein
MISEPVHYTWEGEKEDREKTLDLEDKGKQSFPHWGLPSALCLLS